MKIIGVMMIGLHLGLNVYGYTDDSDYVYAGFNDDKPRKYKLYEAERGNYFKIKGIRYYLDDFIRV